MIARGRLRTKGRAFTLFTRLEAGCIPCTQSRHGSRPTIDHEPRPDLQTVLNELPRVATVSCTR
jgi:hypothetical protein